MATRKPAPQVLCVLRVRMDDGSTQSRLVRGESYARISHEHPGCLSVHQVVAIPELMALAEVHPRDSAKFA